MNRFSSTIFPGHERAMLPESNLRDGKVRVGLVGVGKMGLSHLALLGAHPRADVVAICDASGYVPNLIRKYTGIETYKQVDEMVQAGDLDAIVVATPTGSHYEIVKAALAARVAVFCEKPLVTTADHARELVYRAESQSVVCQVGYHNRFVATFQEVKRLVEQGAVGRVVQALGEAYGPVVVRESGRTWRSGGSGAATGAGSLYDYGAHPVNLMTWYLGPPEAVIGTATASVFSRETDDIVSSVLQFGGGASAQLSVNWSDESQRKMTTRITLWGTEGTIYADRQECHVYLRGGATIPSGYRSGWNRRYITDLVEPVYFYLRGEEYSAEIDYFLASVALGRTDGENSFRSSLETDRALEWIRLAAAGVGSDATVASQRTLRSRTLRGVAERIRAGRSGQAGAAPSVKSTEQQGE